MNEPRGYSTHEPNFLGGFVGNICPKCAKPYVYIGDFIIGQEPYCVCGTHVCKECGTRVKDKL